MGVITLDDVRGGLARGGQYVAQKWHDTSMFLPGTRISCCATLSGLLAALSLLGACGEANGPAGIGTRAVVIGIDGADWRIVDAIAAHA